MSWIRIRIKAMNTEENIVYCLRRLGLNPTPLEKVGHYISFEDTDIFYCPDDENPEIFRMILPLSVEINDENREQWMDIINDTNNIMKLTTVSIIDEETIWISYRSYIFGTEPLDQMIEVVVKALKHAKMHMIKLTEG